MEELKALIGMVNQLPQLALWVLIGFWAYKVICVGSIYGIIRFIVDRFVKWRTAPVQYQIKSKTIDADVLHLLELQISRLGGEGYYNYIHKNDVKWLQTAIDERFAKEQEEKRESITTVRS